MLLMGKLIYENFIIICYSNTNNEYLHKEIHYRKMMGASTNFFSIGNYILCYNWA